MDAAALLKNGEIVCNNITLNNKIKAGTPLKFFGVFVFMYKVSLIKFSFQC